MRHYRQPPSTVRAFAVAALATSGAFVFAACGSGCDTDPNKDPAKADPAATKAGDKAPEATVQVTKGPLVYGEKCATLFAGQTINAGEVCAIVAGDNLNVRYTTTGGWTLTEAHAWADKTTTSLPTTNKGNAIPGQFPYKTGPLAEGTTSATLSVPLSVFGLNGAMTECDPVTAYVAAHAALKKVNQDGSVQTETGWGDGPRIVAKGNWGTMFSLPLGCKPNDPPPPVGCETAFVRHATANICFRTIDESYSRWGWSNGPLAEGNHSFEVYAGAAQCDTSKGTKVGTATVVYAAGTATVVLTALNGFHFDETHLYVGNEQLPRDKQGDPTIAPGQFPHQHDLVNATSDTFTVPNLAGDIHVVFHSVACGSALGAVD